MLAIVSESPEVIAVIPDRAEIEPALRAWFWHNEVGYAAARAAGDTAVAGEHGYVWDGLDLADIYWTLWARVGDTDGERIGYLAGHIEDAPLWP